MSESLLSEKEVMGEVYAVAEPNLVKKIIIMKVMRRVSCILNAAKLLTSEKGK